MQKITVILFAVLICVGACKKQSNTSATGTPDSSNTHKPNDTPKEAPAIIITTVYSGNWRDVTTCLPPTYSYMDKDNTYQTSITVTEDTDNNTIHFGDTNGSTFKKKADGRYTKSGYRWFESWTLTDSTLSYTRTSDSGPCSHRTEFTGTK